MTNETIEGIALFDHPGNPNHPVAFHVRDDGWMGACLSFGKPLQVTRGESLPLRYGLWIHAGMPAADAIDRQWQAFSRRPLPDAAAAKRSD